MHNISAEYLRVFRILIFCSKDSKWYTLAFYQIALIIFMHFTCTKLIIKIWLKSTTTYWVNQVICFNFVTVTFAAFFFFFPFNNSWCTHLNWVGWFRVHLCQCRYCLLSTIDMCLNNHADYHVANFSDLFFMADDCWSSLLHNLKVCCRSVVVYRDCFANIVHVNDGVGLFILVLSWPQ